MDCGDHCLHPHVALVWVLNPVLFALLGSHMTFLNASFTVVKWGNKYPVKR